MISFVVCVCSVFFVTTIKTHHAFRHSITLSRSGAPLQTWLWLARASGGVACGGAVTVAAAVTAAASAAVASSGGHACQLPI